MLLNSRKRFGTFPNSFAIPSGWRHIECSLDNAGQARIFINGILRATVNASTFGTGSTTVSPGSGPMYIGRYSIVDGGAMKARMDNFRMTRGSSVRHTADFSPDPAEFGSGMDPRWADVTSALSFEGADNSTVFTDLVRGVNWTRSGSPIISTANYIAGGSAGKFESGDYIGLAQDSTTRLTQPWTIDFWIYKAAYGDLGVAELLWQNGQQASIHAGCTINMGTDGSISFGGYRDASSVGFSVGTVGP